ncbi:MAG: alpha/beta hydrolase [Deltaproteobacteria bacterium]|nr:alpha/beta hydrolase [Deltaproteobacteria bacterium]
MRQRLIETGKVKIEVELYGEAGPLVVLAPANSRGAADFSQLGRSLSEAGYRAAAVNPRGAGKSEGPLEGLTLHDLAAVIETLDGAPAAVVGHAFGNRVARCLASNRPELVRCLVLLAAGGKVPPQSPEFLKAAATLRTKGITEEQRKTALQAAFFARNSDPTPWLIGMWPAAGKAQGMANQATPLEEWWGGGTAPTLVIQGEEDICAPLENGRLLKEEYGDRITFKNIPDAAHALLLEQPTAVREAVIAYLKKHHG